MLNSRNRNLYKKGYHWSMGKSKQESILEISDQFEKVWLPDRKKPDLKSLPRSPGVYVFLNQLQVPIYVGKSKCLRKRVSQYFRARRIKKHLKMKAIRREAVTLHWKLLPTELDAELKEIDLIQVLRPKFNVAGAFSFLYPMLGMHYEDQVLTLAFTTDPSLLLKKQMEIFGSFRSRGLTSEAYFALRELFRFSSFSRGKLMKEHSENGFFYAYRYSRIELEQVNQWKEFFLGYSPDALKNLSLRLIEIDEAAKYRVKVEENLKILRRFYRFEAKSLRDLIRKTGFKEYPVPQKERDRLFLRSRRGSKYFTTDCQNQAF